MDITDMPQEGTFWRQEHNLHHSAVRDSHVQGHLSSTNETKNQTRMSATVQHLLNTDSLLSF